MKPFHNIEKGSSRKQVIALCGAWCLFLSSFEYLLPRPVPFFRYGFANIPLLIALPFFSVRDFILLVLLKVVGQAIVHGTLFSYVVLFSLGGSVAAAILMLLVYRIGIKRVLQQKKIPAMSLIGVSTIGASMSSGVQVLLSVVFVFGGSSWVIAPYLLALGIVSGIFVGICAECYIARSSILLRIKETYNA